MSLNFSMHSCWICGERKNLTGEHKIKKSDLDSEGVNRPTFLTTKKSKTKIQGRGSSELKFPNSICAKCNNQITQPADLAYECFRETLKNKSINQLMNSEVSVSTAVAQYFGKHLGCSIKYQSFPVPERISKFVLDEGPCCVAISIKKSPQVFVTDDTNEEIPINCISPCAILFSEEHNLPIKYRTSFMNDGLQFIVEFHFDQQESAQMVELLRNGLIPFKEIDDETSTSLGL